MPVIPAAGHSSDVTQTIWTWTGLRREDVGTLQVLTDRHSIRRYPADVELIRQGDMSDEVVVVHEGVIKLVHVACTGHQRILGLRLGPSVIGLASAVAKEPEVASAVTVTRCGIESITVECFCKRLRDAPKLMWLLLQIEAREVLEHMVRSADAVCCSSRARLAKLLLAIAEVERPTSTNGVKLTLPLKRAELASLVGITPEHFSRIFRELQNSGVVSVEKGWIIVRDLEGLRAEASGRTTNHPRTRIKEERI